MRADTIARLGDFEFLLSQGVAPLDAARRCGWKSPADIIKRIERARRADSTREGIASAYRRLDEAKSKTEMDLY